MQKGLAPILIVLILAILGIGGYFVYTSLRGFGEAGDVAISPSPTPQPSPSSADTDESARNISSKINGFPIYPNAVFIKTETVPPCKKDSYSGFSICNSITYAWKVNENLTKVIDWYKNNNSGWKFSGGAGQLDEKIGGAVKETYKKGDLSYDLNIQGSPTLTMITLIIPLGPPEGNINQ